MKIRVYVVLGESRCPLFTEQDTTLGRMRATEALRKGDMNVPFFGGSTRSARCARRPKVPAGLKSRLQAAFRTRPPEGGTSTPPKFRPKASWSGYSTSSLPRKCYG